MAAGLTPANGATGLSVTTTFRIEFCGMTGLEINYFNLLNPQGSVVGSPGSPAFDVTQGDYWAELKPHQNLTEGVTYSLEIDGRINDSGTIKQLAAGTWDVTIAVSDTEFLYHKAFNDTGYSSPHQFSEAQIKNYLGADYFQGATEGQVELAADPAGGGRGDVLKIDYQPNCIGSTPDLNLGVCGSQAQIHFSDNGIAHKDEVYLAYDVFFPSDYVFPRLQKTIALMSDEHSGGIQSEEGKELYLIMLPGGGPSEGPKVDQGLLIYTTDAADGQLNDHSTGVIIQKGVWNQIELHAKLNDLGSSNGEGHLYLNGAEIYGETNKVWIDNRAPTIDWEQILLHFYVGGSSSEFYHPKAQSMYIDELTLSDNRITG